jgi:hypothetical protein
MHWYNLRESAERQREYMSDRRLTPGDELILDGTRWRVVSTGPADPAYEATVHIEPASRDLRRTGSP